MGCECILLQSSFVTKLEGSRVTIVRTAILPSLWSGQKTAKPPKVVFNRGHIGREFIHITKRPLRM